MESSSRTWAAVPRSCAAGASHMGTGSRSGRSRRCSARPGPRKHSTGPWSRAHGRRRSGRSGRRSKALPRTGRSSPSSTTSTGPSRRSSTSSSTSPTGRASADPAALRGPAGAARRPPGLGRGEANATSLLLEPLTGRECEQLIDEPPRAGRLPSRSPRRIVEAAEGNPLFVEELLEMLIDDGSARATTGAGSPSPISPARRPADDPGAARGPARPARPASAASSSGPRSRARSSIAGAVRRALPERARPRSWPHLLGARPQGADPARPARLRRRGRVPLPPPAHPRRRLRGACRRRPAPSSTSDSPTGSSGRPATACRVRGDPRLPPRAGVPVSRRAGNGGRGRGVVAAGRRAACYQRPSRPASR